MLRRLFAIGLVISVLSTLAAFAGEARIIKVLPFLLDEDGQNARSPSLFERDVYQSYLRTHPEEVFALSFEVQLKAKHEKSPIVLKIEVRTGNTEFGKVRVFEKTVKPSHWFSTWEKIVVDKATAEQMGTVQAWRATLWRDGEQVAEQESFLW